MSLHQGEFLGLILGALLVIAAQVHGIRTNGSEPSLPGCLHVLAVLLGLLLMAFCLGAFVIEKMILGVL